MEKIVNRLSSDKPIDLAKYGIMREFNSSKEKLNEEYCGQEGNLFTFSFAREIAMKSQWQENAFEGQESQLELKLRKTPSVDKDWFL